MDKTTKATLDSPTVIGIDDTPNLTGRLATHRARIDQAVASIRERGDPHPVVIAVVDWGEWTRDLNDQVRARTGEGITIHPLRSGLTTYVLARADARYVLAAVCPRSARRQFRRPRHPTSVYQVMVAGTDVVIGESHAAGD